MPDLKPYEAVKALIFYKNKILLLKQIDSSGGEYEIPGGRKEKNESDEETLKREVLEETSLKIEILELLNTWNWDVVKKGFHLDGKTYLCKAITNNIKLSKEYQNYKLVNFKELSSLKVPEWFNDAVSKMKIKKCAGAVIYDSVGRIFLMTSPKWNKYVVPGGRIEKGETDVEALRREMKEELGIEITDIVKINESIKEPSSDFKDPTLTFHYVSFSAKALQTNIVPNEEISGYGWYTVEEALKLPLLDSTESLIRECIALKVI